MTDAIPYNSSRQTLLQTSRHPDSVTFNGIKPCIKPIADLTNYVWNSE